MKEWLVVGATTIAAPTAAAAQSSPVAATPGEAVSDPDGGTVGTIVLAKGDAAVVDTGSAKLTLGLSSFRRRDGKLTLPIARYIWSASAISQMAICRCPSPTAWSYRSVSANIEVISGPAPVKEPSSWRPSPT